VQESTGAQSPWRYSYDRGLKKLATSAGWRRDEILTIVDFAASIYRAKRASCP